MIHPRRTTAPTLLRFSAAIIAAAVLIVTVVVAPSTPKAAAAETKTALFGTVVGKPHGGSIDIVTRDGAISLQIDADTKINLKAGKKKRKLKPSDIRAGMTVSGYYTVADGGPVAENLTFVRRRQKKTFEHVVGVVLERNGSHFTVKTSNGEIVEIESENGDGGNRTDPGSMIATVVEVDATTGELKSMALRTAAETVEKLSNSISHEISVAQQKLLKIRMSETASVHMTRLYETLDEIQAETQAKIQAAYAEFQANYDATLQNSSVEKIKVQMRGRVINVLASELHVMSLTDGTRWHFRVTGATVVELGGGALGTVADLAVGQLVEVDATPGLPPAWPVARAVRDYIGPDPDIGATTSPVPAEDTITGTIVLVQKGSVDSDPVVVVVLEDGTDGAALLTDDTVIIVEGEELTVDELEPGQSVQIVLTDDGFSAEEVQASAPVEPTPGPGGGTPVAPPNYTLYGTLRSVDETGVVVDGVRLQLDNFSTTWDSSDVGQAVELQFFVDDEGRLVVTGAK